MSSAAFCLGEKSASIFYSLVSISRPHPVVLCLSHDWHTQSDSPELGEGKLFLLWIHTSILHFLSIKARQCWWIFIWCIPGGQKRDALLCVNVSCSHFWGRSKMGFEDFTLMGNVQYCSGVASSLELHQLSLNSWAARNECAQVMLSAVFFTCKCVRECPCDCLLSEITFTRCTFWMRNPLQRKKYVCRTPEDMTKNIASLLGDNAKFHRLKDISLWLWYSKDFLFNNMVSK